MGNKIGFWSLTRTMKQNQKSRWRLEHGGLAGGLRKIE